MAFQGDSIYWVEVEKVVPNPFQPRREFDQHRLQELADSIRMYGVLQPLTVTRNEIVRDDGTFYSEYELIAGERRLRASRLAGVSQVPVIIRSGEQTEQEKLELAIIENLQREDLNAVDRALAFKQLAEVFGLSHSDVARKVGRSREYVSNSIRLLGLPEHILDSLRLAKLSEGHARTLLMLNDRREEQEVVFQEILLKKLSVREVERIARKIATDKIRKKNPDDFDVHLIEIEKQFTETLGTRVQIQKTDFGGKLTIDYFSTDDLEVLLQRIKHEYHSAKQAEDGTEVAATLTAATPLSLGSLDNPTLETSMVEAEHQPVFTENSTLPEAVFVPEVADDIAEETIIEPEQDDSDLYSINSFTV
ncbi:MAG: ParB/RepB/Spo0J family partition protein [Patescibacteria group bacterium]